MRLALLLIFAPGIAMAQATANPGALDSLTTPKPAPRRTVSPAPRSTTAPATPARPSAPTAGLKPTTGRQPLPTVPTAPPPIASLPPPTPVPVRPTPPSVIPLATDAPGGTSPLPSGLRVTFGPDRSDLSATTVQALRQYAATLGNNENTTVTIMAYAPGAPEDPSTPRRLSLARALATRAVLMDSGIASTRIYPRAMGPAPDAIPDRVDLIRYPPTESPRPEPPKTELPGPELSRPESTRPELPNLKPPRPGPIK